MAKWVGWIAYFFWGLLCFFIFFHLFFPYGALGRRIFNTLQQKTNLVTKAPEPETRFLGIRWDHVEISYPGQKAFPPIRIQDLVIEIRPLSLFVGRLSAVSHGTVMSGTFHAGLVVEGKRYRGSAEWNGVQFDRFPLPSLENAFFGGTASGTVSWERVDEVISGDAFLEMRDGSIRNLPFAGLTLPRLDLGQIKGNMNWKGGRINLKEISVTGKDLNANVTGDIFFQSPFVKSKVTCRLEIGIAENLLNRYPAIRAFSGSRQGQAKPFVLTVRGTLGNPRFSLASR